MTRSKGIFNILIVGMLSLIGMGVAILPLLTHDQNTSISWMTALLAMGPFLVLVSLIVHNNHQIRGLRSEIFYSRNKLQSTQTKLEQTQSKLENAAQLAGATELATGILHNVGNVLNGVNVSVSQINQSLRDSRMDALNSIVQLMQQQGENLPNFIATDQRGMNLVEALAQLEQIREEEAEFLSTELRELSNGVNHMRNIIDMQQSSATNAHQHENFNVSEVIQDAVKLYSNALARLQIELSLQLDEQLQAQTDRPIVMHILVNLISNARNAIAESTHGGLRKITIQSQQVDQWAQVQITDTGCGIDSANLKHLFEYGFTTRDSGHGFGLHHSINAARELGGTLSVHSDGVGTGATFTLQIPVIATVANRIL